MEKINNIFLNYKTYNAFQRDLNAGKISPNSIAFIQDNLRIWAHGKEYACNGLSIQNTGQGSMEFVDALGNTVLTLSADPNGYVNIAGITGDAYDVFISKGDFANYVEVVEQLKRDFEKYKSVIGQLDNFILLDQVESTIDPDSAYPVQSRKIYQAFENILEQLNTAMQNKQDVLVAGKGITITGNTISSNNTNMVTLTKTRYDSLVEQELIDPETYYFTYEGEEPSGETWHFGDHFPIILTGTWEFGGTFPITLS